MTVHTHNLWRSPYDVMLFLTCHEAKAMHEKQNSKAFLSLYAYVQSANGQAQMKTGRMRSSYPFPKE